MVDCGLQELSPSAFSGLESTLQMLDLSGNNITSLPPHLLQVNVFSRIISLLVLLYDIHCCEKDNTTVVKNILLCRFTTRDSINS